MSGNGHHIWTSKKSRHFLPNCNVKMAYVNRHCSAVFDVFSISSTANGHLFISCWFDSHNAMTLGEHVSKKIAAIFLVCPYTISLHFLQYNLWSIFMVTLIIELWWCEVCGSMSTAWEFPARKFPTYIIARNVTLDLLTSIQPFVCRQGRASSVS